MTNYQDEYCRDYPRIENAIDIFDWISKLPFTEGRSTGNASLFSDQRIMQILDFIGDVTDKRVLELGPLEGGHAYMMNRQDPISILSIEANPTYFLKCLLVKELYDIDKWKLRLGDFEKYLDTACGIARYDFVLASGVVYHSIDPMELLYNITGTTDTIGLWSHYYAPEIVPKIYGDRFNAEPIPVTRHDYNGTYYEQTYKEALNDAKFCGGLHPNTRWMSMEDWYGCLREWGFELNILEDNTENPLGPSFTGVAVRKSGI